MTVKEIIEKSGLQCSPEQIEQLVAHFDGESYYEFNRAVIQLGFPGAMEILPLAEVLKNAPKYFTKATQKVNHDLSIYSQALTKNKAMLETAEAPPTLVVEDRKDFDSAVENITELRDFYDDCVAKFNAGKKICLKMKDPESGDHQAIFTTTEKNLSIMILRMMT